MLDIDGRANDAKWPNCESFNSSFLPEWQYALCFTTRHKRYLDTPLGKWYKAPGDKWQWFFDHGNDTLYQQEDKIWQGFRLLSSNTRQRKFGINSFTVETKPDF